MMTNHHHLVNNLADILHSTLSLWEQCYITRFDNRFIVNLVSFNKGRQFDNAK